MIIIPAIDLMGGKCVRLIKGERQRLIEYDKDPLELAQEYQDKGAKIIHVVDLDGAFSGTMKNLPIIKELAKRFQIEVGGGIRSREAIDDLLEAGVKKIVVSTLLLKDEGQASEIKKDYKGRLIGSFDFKDGKLSYAGWTKKSSLSFRQVAQGLDEVVVTDTSRDGTFTGPNFTLIGSLKEQCDARIIAAGGIRDMSDLLELRNLGIYGAIVGRAFLENKIKLDNDFNFELEKR